MDSNNSTKKEKREYKRQQEELCQNETEKEERDKNKGDAVYPI